MTEDKEAAAIAAVINALAGLDEPSCARVLEYATRRFAPNGGIEKTPWRKMEELQVSPEVTLRHATVQPQADIKALKEEKKPANSIQMAVLVAYYLKELAPAAERKDSIGPADATKYFNQARFSLPTGTKGLGDTLNNARRSGYLETAGSGQFRLTPVGHNLAAYKMPTKGTAK